MGIMGLVYNIYSSQPNLMPVSLMFVFHVDAAIVHVRWGFEQDDTS